MIFDFTARGLARRPRTRAEPPPARPSVLLGTTDSHESVFWDPPSGEEAAHCLALGATGTGKTTLIAHAIIEEYLLLRQQQPDAPPSLAIIEPKGDLARAILEGIAFRDPALLGEVRYLDPFSLAAFPLNLCQLQQSVPLDILAFALAGLVAEVSTGAGAQKHLGIGARQVDTLQQVILGALSSSDDPRANILWALDALVVRQGLKRLASVSTSARARQFLENTHLSEELVASCASRIRLGLAATENLERLVAAPTCVDIDEILGPGRITIVDVSRPSGGLGALRSLYANLIARLIFDRLLARESPWRGHRTRLVIDEAHLLAPVLADRAEEALTTGRSKRLALLLATQGTALIASASPTLLPVILANVARKFVGRLAASDAELLAREQAPRPGVEERHSVVRERFAGTAANLDDREFLLVGPNERQRFRTVDIDLAGWSAAVIREAVAITAARERLALPANLPRRVTLDEAVPLEPRRSTGGKRRSPAAPSTNASNAPAQPLQSGRTRWG